MKKALIWLLVLLSSAFAGGRTGRKPMLGELPDASQFPMPTALWLFNEGCGTKVYDLSGNGNVGTLSSGTVWVPGKYGPALDIEAVGQPVTLTSEIDIDLGTIIVWARWSGNGKDLLGKYDASNRLGIYDLDSVVIEDSGGAKVYPDIPAMVAGQRFCLAVTYDGTNWVTYLDGVYCDQPRAASNMLIDTIGNGHDGDSVIWDDDIDMVYLYDVVLTSSEIAHIYRDPFYMFEPDPIEVWESAIAAPAVGGQVIHIMIGCLSIPIITLYSFSRLWHRAKFRS